MTYQETLNWLFAQLPMYQREGKAAYKADLSNTEWLMDELNHPEQKFKAIHVGGTNGKGSCSHMLASIFQEAGYKTGLYTSPHLIDFRERIRINGEEIAEEKVLEFVSNYKSLFEEKGLSFFEWTVGLAFFYFAQQAVDIAIIEVGLGGRLDSTNVISPELSVITNIGMDHAQFLGNTKAKIATEKAGIIKPETPILIGEQQEETSQVFVSKAAQVNAPLHFAEDFNLEVLPSDLGGEYQTKNVNTVRAAIHLLRNNGWTIAEKDEENGLLNVVGNTHLKGRWQVLQKDPFIVCDVGHNKEGLTYNIKQLEKSNEDFCFLLGFVNDKDIKEILSLFPPAATFIFVKPDVPRGANTETVTQHARKLKLKYTVCPSISSALELYQNTCAKDHALYVGGSTFVVSDFIKVWS